MSTWTATLAAFSGAGGLCAGGALAGGLRGPRRQSRAALAQVFAAGLMLALVALDLIPDALTDARESGSSAYLVLITFAVLASGTWWLLRPRLTGHPEGSGCCMAGSFGTWAIALHGVLEGMALGLGLGLDIAAGPVLLCALSLHKTGEGFALRVSLRSADTSRRRVQGWVLLAAISPVLGALFGSLVSLNSPTISFLSIALAAILAAVALNLISPIIHSRTAAKTAKSEFTWQASLTGVSAAVLLDDSPSSPAQSAT